MDTTPKTWAHIVTQIQNSGIKQLHLQQQQKRLRKQLYRESLLNEINQHESTAQKAKIQKRKQRSLIQLKAILDNDADRRKKQERMKRLQNMNKDNFSALQTQMHANKNQISYESPFGKLEDEHSKKATKRQDHNYQLYKINQINLQQKRKFVNSVRKNEINSDIEHVRANQNLFKKIDQSRKNYEKKYLIGGLKKQLQTDTLEQHYAMFLNRQISQKKHNIQKQKQLDSGQGLFNSRLQAETYSPAFIGRVPLNNDRKMQLQYLDKQLRRRNPMLHKRAVTQIKQQNKTFQHSLVNIEKNPELSTAISIKSRGKTQSELNVEEEKKQKRNFKQLDVISGTSIIRQW